jgi:DNA-binding MarR family transcriptional regulator
MASKTDDPVTMVPLERIARLLRADEHAGELNPAQWEALRYLSRCNRFSDSPVALARYLGATKGTVSQSLIALERKGLISKSARPGESRSIVLALTDNGYKMLEEDPWAKIEEMAGHFGPKVRKRLLSGNAKLLARLLAERQLPSFGTCSSCRYFREGGAPEETKGKHWCLLFEQPVTNKESDKICASHDPH